MYSLMFLGGGIGVLPPVVAVLRPYDPLDIPEDPKTCPNCLAAYESPDSRCCWNCGADFGASLEAGDLKQALVETYLGVEARKLEESECSISIGKCMVVYV
jgi:hypothetical protein